MDDPYVYVVTRDGRRVSHTNHESRQEALDEARYWTNLIHKVINGRKVDPHSIVTVARVRLSKCKKIR
jgi:hypothetical protein